MEAVKLGLGVRWMLVWSLGGNITVFQSKLGQVMRTSIHPRIIIMFAQKHYCFLEMRKFDTRSYLLSDMYCEKGWFQTLDLYFELSRWFRVLKIMRKLITLINNTQINNKQYL